MINTYSYNLYLFFLLISIVLICTLILFHKEEVSIGGRSEFTYKNMVLNNSFLCKVFNDHKMLLKLNNRHIEKEYMNIFFISLFFSVLLFIFSAIALNILFAIFLLIATYIIVPYVYGYSVKAKDKVYKSMLSKEVVELFLTFHLLYPTYRNPDFTLRYILSIEKSEINRQIESMLIFVSEKGVKKGAEKMLDSLKGVDGLDIFIELYVNLKKEGAKALQNINSYISNIIKIREMDAEKKINETKTKIELITAIVIFVGLVILILAPMFLGKFDGENSLIDYLGNI